MAGPKPSPQLLPWMQAMRARSRSFRLTRRELEVLSYMVTGLSNRQIAARCCICEQTVKDHLKHIYSKIGAHQRTAVVARLFGFKATS